MARKKSVRAGGAEYVHGRLDLYPEELVAVRKAAALAGHRGVRTFARRAVLAEAARVLAEHGLPAPDVPEG